MTTNPKEALRVATMKVKIHYRPRYWSLVMHSTVLRWIVLIIHRRGGKTTAAFNHLQRAALLNDNTRYAYIAPTYRQAKRIVWKMAKEYAPTDADFKEVSIAREVDGTKFNESELLITYPNGSEIMILGASQADTLRGIALWGCFLDEYPLMSPLIFTEIITKCLADHLGFCIFGGTPKGKGHFFKIYQAAQKNPEEWCLVYRTIEQSLEQEGGPTIEALRQALHDDQRLVEQGLMTQEEFEQEWYNSFEAAIRGAVYLKELSAARQKKRIRLVPWTPHEPVYTVWDLGVSKSDAMAVGFYQKIAGQTRMIDYYQNTGLGLVHYAKVVKEKPYVYGKHFAPHDIRQKELISGKTRLETARKLGINFEVVPSLSLDDGIDLARAFFHTLFIDSTNCELWLDLMGQYKYEFDEKTGQFTSRPIHDFTSHAADIHRYAAIVEEYMVPDDFAMPPQQDDAVPDDDFMGDLEHEDETNQEGFGKSPTMKGVNIGALGHKPPPRQE